MPVSDEGAALQFFVEAMKANTATLERIGKAMEGVQREQSETLKLVHDTRERVIKLESNRLQSEIDKLQAEVADLKEDKLRREGAANLASNTITKGPVITTILVGLIVVLIVLVANGKIG